jgi:hypothetical protein
MHWLKGLLLTLTFLSLSIVVSGQTHADTLALLVGKWSVCDEWNYSAIYNCKEGYIGYELFSDQTLKGLTHNPQTLKEGVWKLNGTELILLDSDKVAPDHWGVGYKIIWLDKNRFYSKGPYGPNQAIKYLYFQRK